MRILVSNSSKINFTITTYGVLVGNSEESFCIALFGELGEQELKVEAYLLLSKPSV